MPGLPNKIRWKDRCETTIRRTLILQQVPVGYGELLHQGRQEAQILIAYDRHDSVRVHLFRVLKQTTDLVVISLSALKSKGSLEYQAEHGQIHLT